MTSSVRALSIAFAGLVVTLAACQTTEPLEPAGNGGVTPSPSAPATSPDGGQPPVGQVPTTPSDGGGTTPVNPTNPAWGSSKCPALPAGKQAGLMTGQQLPPLTVKDCDGNDYALENVCGASATYLFVAHGWCPYCRNATKSSETLLASYAGKNVAFVNVLVENAQSQPPTMTDCKAWRDTYKLTNVIALYDPTGVTKGLFDAGSSALGVYMDDERVIRSKTIHTDDQTAIKGGIDGALQP
jgi:hypothetical protein